MQPFDQTESGFTATAATVTIPASTDYDVAVLDNPVRAKTNAALVVGNLRAYQQTMGGV